MTNQSTDHTCPACGHPYPNGSIICSACHKRLRKSFMANPPSWFIALLLAVIAILLVVAAVTAWQVLILHQY